MAIGALMKRITSLCTNNTNMLFVNTMAPYWQGVIVVFKLLYYEMVNCKFAPDRVGEPNTKRLSLKLVVTKNKVNSL